MCKRIFNFKLQLSRYWQISNFSWYCPKFLIFTKIVIFQVYLQLFIPIVSSYQFYDRDMPGILFFHFCQLWGVNRILAFTLAMSIFWYSFMYNDGPFLWQNWMYLVCFAEYHTIFKCLLPSPLRWWLPSWIIVSCCCCGWWWAWTTSCD